MINPLEFSAALNFYLNLHGRSLNETITLILAPVDYPKYDTYLVGLGLVINPDHAMQPGTMSIIHTSPYFNPVSMSQRIEDFIKQYALQPQRQSQGIAPTYRTYAPGYYDGYASKNKCTCGCSAIKSERHSSWCDAL